MSARDLADNLQQQARTIGLEKISQLITAYQKQNEPIEDDAIIKWFMYAPLIDLHDTTITLGVPTFDEPVDHDGYGQFGFRKEIPDLVDAYDLVHDDSNAALITFPKPGITQFQPNTIGVKFSGAAQTPGTEWQEVDDNAKLNVVDRIGFAGWMYIPSTVTVGSVQRIISKFGQYQLQLQNKTNMLGGFTRSGGEAQNARTVPNDVWFSFAFGYDTVTGITSFINKVSGGAGATGNLLTTTNKLSIWGRAGGTELLENTIALAGVVILHDKPTQAWINKFHDDGILDHDTDLDGLEEITFLPYIDSLQAMPNAFAGMFIGS